MTATAIAIAQQKGGAGKTTIAVQLAVHWAIKGRKVALLDIDPQGSVTAWARLRDEAGIKTRGPLQSFHPAGWKLAGEIDRLKRDFDLILIDTPPHAETDARVAVRAASLVIAPIQPSLMDLWASGATLDLAKMEKTPFLLVLNRLPPRGKLVDAVRAEVAARNLPLAQSGLGNRSAFAASMAEGKSVEETQPKSVAALELAALADEITGLLKGKKK